MTKVTTVRKPNLHLYLPWLRKQPRERDFVLNCVATDWKLPEYNGLQDRHLVYFYANSKVKTNLIRTGALDTTLDATLVKRTQIQLPTQKRLPTNAKLPPISNEKDTNAQRIVAPYRNKKDQQKVAKLSKYHSTPEKKAPAVINTVNAMTPPKRVQKVTLNEKAGNGVRKVHPLSKEQLEQVFAKYQIKTVQSNPNFSTDASNAGEERSISEDYKKSEPSPVRDNILISVAKMEPNDELFDFNLEKVDEVKVEPQPEVREEEQPEVEMVKETEEVGMEEAMPEDELQAEEKLEAEIEAEVEVEVEQKQTELSPAEVKPVDDVVENVDNCENKPEEYSFEEVY